MSAMQKSRGLVSFVVLAGLGIATFGCSSNRWHGKHEEKMEHEALVSVEAIDVPNRLVTVRDANSIPLTVYVDPSVKSFPQSSVGDRVRIKYVESVALQLVKPGEPAKDMHVKEETSPLSKGSGSASTEVKATVKIESVQDNGSLVTFTGPRGRRTVHIIKPSVRDYASKLRPGDNVEVTYREALALSLEKA